MYSAGDFRNGVTFEWEGNVYTVVEFQHVKPGKGAAFVRTKIKNVITGGVIEHSFSPTEKFPQAFIERKDMEYLYNDGDLWYFMDQESYEHEINISSPTFLRLSLRPSRAAFIAAPKALKSYFGTGLFAIVIHPLTFYCSPFFLDMST